MTKGPVLIDLEDQPQAPSPAEAPAVPDPSIAAPDGRAMQVAARLAAGRPSYLARWFWGVLLTLTGAVVSVAAWDFVMSLIERSPILGYGVSGLVGVFLLVLLLIALRELAGFARLRRMDVLHHQAEQALANEDLQAARKVVARVQSLYRGREDTAWGCQRLTERQDDMFDAAGLLGLVEVEVLGALDKAAAREIEAAARQVATVTALVPLAMADVVVALTANLRMIRRIAEVYGGRSGTLGSWRLLRAVMSHLVATGAVAVGDDMLGSFAGGGVLGKLSRRFGEGVINGALTARVGVAAMEVCRPIPFAHSKRPSVTSLLRRALAGLFGQS